MAKELPYYKFNVAEFLLGRISSEKDSIIGAFMLASAHYWHKECNVSRSEIEKKLSKSRIKKLISLNYLVEIGSNISIPFLDEQWVELSESINKRSSDGKKGAEIRWGGNATPIALREDKEVDKDKIRKEIDIKEIFFNDLPNSSILFSICRDLKIEKIQAVSRIEEFRPFSNTEYKSFTDFANHFKNWLRKNPEPSKSNLSPEQIILQKYA